MKVNDDLFVIPVSVEMPGRSMVINLSLILDAEHGLTLVDASMPGEEKGVEAALSADGFAVADLKHVIITHQDLDHIGGLAAIKAASGATVYAHSIEAPYIEGKTKMLKSPTQEMLEKNPVLKGFFDLLQFSKVDKSLEDGEILDLAGGVRVIFTPGHTPGHICLFLERSKTLITGDALVSTDGQLGGPNPGATPDMPTAIESVKKLAALAEVNTIVTYHGGLVTDDALGQLRRVSEELQKG